MGRCPKPREGFALRTHQGLRPLDRDPLGHGGKGADRGVSKSVSAPFPHDPINGIQGPALVGVEGAKPLAGSGAEPRGLRRYRLPPQAQPPHRDNRHADQSE